MIDTVQSQSVAAAHAYLNRKALKRAEREKHLLFGIVLGWGIFVGMIIGIKIALLYFRGSIALLYFRG